MQAEKIDSLVNMQRTYFRTGETLPVSFRLGMLKRLRDAVRRYEGEITQALRTDLGKSAFEGYMCETGMALSEISYMIRHARRFAVRQRVWTPLHEFAANSWKQSSPYGNTLIMSPWNYPFLLTMGPLANAIAAGNTVIVKPSAYSPATAEVIRKLIGECFEEKYIAVVTGGRQENARLLEMKFDFVFFTGSQNVGREVLRHTAETLTPAVLELGGKSPCIVDSTAKIPLAAKRIVFGKYLNCGQTCVAPDYILCQRAVKDELLEAIGREIRLQFGERAMENDNYGKIINEKHFDRICALMEKEKIVFGGGCDRERLKIEPTVMDGVIWDDAVMQEEIFGPVLPVMTFGRMDEVIGMLADRAKPLALYLFTEDRESVRTVTERCSFGGGCVNDTIIHLATSGMGFGGVGESGMGAYHGRTGFEAFSHMKSIVDKKTWLDLPMRYQPYRKIHEKLLRLFLK